MPYNWDWPGWDSAVNRAWDKRNDAPMFPPKTWGAGWGFNFAYPLIKTKPLWKRALAFVIGLLVFLLLIYVLVVICVLIYYLMTPNPNQLTFAITENGFVPV